MSRKMVGIQEAAEFLGVCPQTLRRWEREGRLLPDERTPGGRRRYDLTRFRPELFHTPETQRRTIAYARVSSHDQKDDLERQKQVLERYCARQGWTFEVIADLGSGMNYHPTAREAPPSCLGGIAPTA
jgi:putative resolvase